MARQSTSCPSQPVLPVSSLPFVGDHPLSRPRAGDLGLHSLSRLAPSPAVASAPSIWRAPLAHRRSRIATLLAAALIVVGALVLVDAGVTVVWQEPFTALYAHFRQESLSGEVAVLDRAAPDAEAQRALASLHEEERRIAYLAAALQRHTKMGSPIGRIVIPTIGASFVVVKGTGTSELESGPGIYPETNFPGAPGTTAIAGHRTTYLAPFRHIDELRRGQPIVVEMPYGRFTYSVIGSRVVLPTDVSVIDPVGYSRLVLSACTPPFSASHRLIVFARLRSVVPLGAARAPGGAATLSGGPFSVKGAPGGLPPVLKSAQRLLPPLVS